MTKEKLETQVNKIAKAMIGLTKTFENGENFKEEDVTNCFAFLFEVLKNARNKSSYVVSIKQASDIGEFRLGQQFKINNVAAYTPMENTPSERIVGTKRNAVKPVDDGVDFLDEDD